MSRYLLTFCTPNYNDGKYLAPRLKTLLPFLPDHVEYLVVDDASTDDSVERINQVSKGHQNFSLHTNASNQGVVASVQKLIEQAKGEYLFFLAADDWLVFDNFFTALKLLEQHRPTVLTTDIGHFEDRESGPYDVHIARMIDPSPKFIHIPASEIPHLFSSHHFCIHSAGAFLKRTAVLELGGYNHNLKHYSDFYLNTLIAIKNGLLYVSNCPMCYARNRKIAFSASINPKEVKVVSRFLLKEIKSLPPAIKRSLTRSGILANVLKPSLYFIIINPIYWKLLFM